MIIYMISLGFCMIPTNRPISFIALLCCSRASSASREQNGVLFLLRTKLPSSNSCQNTGSFSFKVYILCIYQAIIREYFVKSRANKYLLAAQWSLNEVSSFLCALLSETAWSSSLIIGMYLRIILNVGFALHSHSSKVLIKESKSHAFIVAVSNSTAL